MNRWSIYGQYWVWKCSCAADSSLGASLVIFTRHWSHILPLSTSNLAALIWLTLTTNGEFANIFQIWIRLKHWVGSIVPILNLSIRLRFGLDVRRRASIISGRQMPVGLISWETRSGAFHLLMKFTRVSLNWNCIWWGLLHFGARNRGSERGIWGTRALQMQS